MKKLLIIALIFVGLPVWGQTLNFRWKSGYTINGNDTTLTDSITGGASSFILRNIDFPLTYITDSNFIPVNNRTSIELPNGDSLNLMTFGVYKRNYNYDSLYFFQIYETQTKADSTLLRPMRIGNISGFSSEADKDSEFNVIPYSDTWLDVPNEYGSITAAHTAASSGDTIIWRTGTQGFYTFTKSHTLAASGDCNFSGGGSITTTSSLTYRQSGVFATRTETANLYTLQGTGNDIEIANCWFDSPQNALSNNVTYTNCHFNGRIDLSVNPIIQDCYFTPSHITWLRSGVNAKFYRSEINGASGSRNTTTLGADPIVRYRGCNIYDGFFTSSVRDLVLDIIKCNYIGTTSTFRFMSLNGETINIDSSNFETGEMFTQDCETSLRNTTFDNMYLFQNSVLSTFSNFTMTECIYNNDLTSTISLFNTIPTINSNEFICSGRFQISFTNTAINPNEIEVNNNSFKWSYSGTPENLLYIDTDSSTAFAKANVTRNEFFLSHYYGNDTAHHTYLNFNTPSYFAYNYVHGAIIGNVVKNTDYITNDVENVIFANIFSECETPIFFRSSRKSQAYNNTIYNDTIQLSNAFSIDDNGGNRNSDSCIIKNNIIRDNNGNYLSFGSTADTVGIQTSNNIVYNANVKIVGSTLGFTTWQSLGYDANSYNTDPNFKSSTELWPVYPSDAIGNGQTLGTPYNIGLDITSSWPDDVLLRKQTTPPTIGSYVIKKPSLIQYNNNIIQFNNKLITF